MERSPELTSFRTARIATIRTRSSAVDQVSKHNYNGFSWFRPRGIHPYRQESFHGFAAGHDVRNNLRNLQVGGVEQVAIRELRDEVDGVVEIRQDQFLQRLELGCLGWLLTEDRVGKLEFLRWKRGLQFPVGHFLVRDVVL